MSSIRDALKKARLMEEGKNLNGKEYQQSFNGVQDKNFAIKIHSDLIHEDIWLLSDDKMQSKIDDDLVVYFPEEVRHLSKIKAGSENIRKVHAVKKIFPGSKIVWN